MLFLAHAAVFGIVFLRVADDESTADPSLGVRLLDGLGPRGKRRAVPSAQE